MNGTRFVLILLVLGFIAAASTWTVYQRVHFSTREAQARGAEVRAFYPSQVAEKITPGMLATVTLEGEGKKKRRGWVTLIEKGGEGRATVVLHLEDPPAGDDAVTCHVTVDGTVHRTDVAP